MGKVTGFMEFERVDETYEAPTKRLHHYKEFVVALTDEEAKIQGARCMDCGIPFCNNGCPVNNIIPDFNDLVFHNDWKNALDVLQSTNNFPEFTGRICPAPCEAACTLGINRAPVGIKSIEHAIIDKGWESGWVKPQPPKTKTGKKVAVVGAGPAGMMAALVAAERGHRVTLFDRAETAGGQLNLARLVPGKEEFNGLVTWFTTRLAKSAIALRLGHEATVSDLTGYDEVIIATGVVPRDAGIPGQSRALGYAEVLRGARVGKRVAVIGAGGIGIDTAEFLSHGTGHPMPSLDANAFCEFWGIDTTLQARGGVAGMTAKPRVSERRIYVLQRRSKKIAGPGKTTGWIHREALLMKGIQLMPGVAYDKIDDAGLHITLADGTQQTLAVDNIVICAGQEPQRELQQGLQALGKTVHLIGGADVAAELDAKRAINQGSRLAAVV